MKMKSLKAQFIGAIAMVLVAAIAMGSSTYAWFSMNLSVTAKEMQVQVKSDSTFLLIADKSELTAANSETQDAAQIKTLRSGNSVSVALPIADANAAVYPSMPWGAVETKTTYPAVNALVTNSDANAPVDTINRTNAAVNKNWITSNNTDPASSTNSIANDKTLNGLAFNDYVIKKTVVLTLSTGSETAHNLKVLPTINVKDTYAKTTDTAVDTSKTYYITSNGGATYTAVESPVAGDLGNYYEKSSATANQIDAVKVLVVTEHNNYVILSHTTSGAQELYSISDANFTPDTTVEADIYIYYDGSDAQVTSNNKANLGAAQIELTFSVEVGNGATGVN